MQNSKDKQIQSTKQLSAENTEASKAFTPNSVHDIYDRIFKRIFSMSELATINLINALFDVHHPLDSHITYLNKESVSSKLKKHFADVFLQINDVTYHLEAQMQKDSSIVMRVFEYGFYHALESWDEDNHLRFPDPIVIYLDSEADIPKTSTLLLDFGQQGTFTYSVKNFLYQDHELRELNQKKMVILIPFQLLKLRKIIARKPSKENLKALQNLIFNDILGSIKSNLDVGNITLRDANELKDLTLQLYDHIYQHYEELGGGTEMRKLLEGAMVLENDKYWDHLEDIEEQNEKLKKNIENLEKEKDSALKEKDNALKMLQEHNAALEAKIATLSERLAKLEP